MTKEQKNEVIELLKNKFSQYSNFYVADTEALTVAQVGKLRRACFDKKVEMRVAKNTLIKKALEALGNEKYSGMYDSLHRVTALMFSENPKDPALIITSFRKASKGERPVLKAAFINGEVYMGNNTLKALTQIKTKDELIGEVIGLLQSPAKRVLAALLNHHEKLAKAEAAAMVAEPEAKPVAAAATQVVTEEKPVIEVTPPVVAEEKPAPVVEAGAKPAENEESKPVEDAEAKPADDAETKPADDAEAKPAE